MDYHCDHPGIPKPKFDEGAARGMTVDQVRKHFPRGWDWCHDCKCTVITYASKAHYVYGDW